MTLKEFFKGRAIVFSILIIIGLISFAYKAYSPSSKDTDVSSQEDIKNSEPPIFAWRFEKDDSLNLDGNNQTNIFLEAAYSNKTVQNKLIDTTPGGCNELPDSDKDSVTGTTNIQCYSAGLGYRFKITKGETSYRVERKTFEEASPEYNPLPHEYEVVAEFPFSN